MIASILEQWTIMRFLRLGMGAWLVFEGVRTHETMFILLGGLFTLQAVFNTGCSGGNCAVPPPKSFSVSKIPETTFEEIK